MNSGGEGIRQAGGDSGTGGAAVAAAAVWTPERSHSCVESAARNELEASSIEKLNVGQPEALGVKDLLKLSNEQIDQITASSNA